MHRDTPIEILHTIRLGPVKYLLQLVISMLKEKKKDAWKLEQLRKRMMSVSSDQLPRPPSVKNILKWMGSMTGRDAALFVQLAPFLLEGLVSDEMMRAWETLGLFHRHAYQREIIDRDSYSREMENLVHALIRDVSHVEPSFIKRPKFHFLVHLAQQALLLGPPMLVASEVFESYNKVVRGIMFVTNRKNPSRDVGVHFVHFRTLRHVTAVGFYLAKTRQDEFIWKQPGE